MLITYCLGWWYGRGWKWRLSKSMQNLAYWGEYFSIGKLFATLFAPYRQTLVGSNRGMQAFMDGLVSRFVGFFVRFFIILAASLLMLVYGIFTFAVVLIWPLVPFLPVVAIVVPIVGAKL